MLVADVERNRLEAALDGARKLGLDHKTVFIWGRSLVLLAGEAETLARWKTLTGDGAIKATTEVSGESPLASRMVHPKDTTVDVGRGVTLDAEHTLMIAGPCAVESAAQVDEVAAALSEMGVRALRGGAFKPRTSLYTFQGMGLRGLEIMREAGDTYDMVLVSEAKDASHIAEVAEFADVIQIGAKSMYLFDLLTKAGESGKPVLLKRGFMTTIKEYLQALEVVLATGNPNVIMCERGIRTFEPQTRFTLDLAGAALLKALSHLPLVVDPSHATGRSDLVGPACRAGVAIGVEGVLVDVHPRPSAALCDSDQALTVSEAQRLRGEVARVAAAVGRSVI